ncbi:MAG: PAS domain S-box protein, partial [Candidatus Omnitrophica bacterium]|nr:PAS domain S-box protein [Candidatus Omnitrophota bacterium]
IEGIITSLNPAFRKITGWKEEEWLGKHFVDIIFHDDLERIKELFVSALSGKSADFKARVLSRSGELIEAEFTAAPQVRNGKIIDILGIGRDISKRNSAEKRVVLLNRLYAIVTKMDKVIIRAKNEEQIFQEACQVLVSQGAFRMSWVGLLEPDNLNVTVVARCGYENGYLDNMRIALTDTPQGRGPTGIALREGRYSVSNDIENDPHMAPWKDEALKRGYRSSASFPFKIGARTVGSINVYAAEPHFFNEEEIGLLLGMAEDISFALEAIQKEDLRKRLEEERDRFFNFSIDMLSIFGFDGYFKQINPAFEKVLGWSRDELLAKPLIDFVYPDDRNDTIKQHKDLLQGKVVTSFENRYLCKNGSYKWISWNSFPLIEKNEVFSVARDITKEKQIIDEIKSAYAKLKQTQDQLVQANKMKIIGTLASGIAHEVRNPLAIIVQGLNFLEISLKPDEEKYQGVLSMIKDAVARADNIIRNLFDFSRPAEAKLNAADINEIVKVSLGLIEKQTLLKNIDIKEDLGKNLPSVMADKNQMEQVFVNIITNAIQAMPQGGTLTIRTLKRDYNQLKDGIAKQVKDVFSSRDKAVVCEIEDTGLGISQDNLRRLFEPFFTTKPPGQGLGLGLGIAKSIIDTHNGLISVESSEGKGTKITITLPLAKNA